MIREFSEKPERRRTLSERTSESVHQSLSKAHHGNLLKETVIVGVIVGPVMAILSMRAVMHYRDVQHDCEFLVNTQRTQERQNLIDLIEKNFCLRKNNVQFGKTRDHCKHLLIC